MPASERVFFALQPDLRVRQGLEQIVASLPEHRGRAVHPADRHLTLAFLGEVPPEQRACAERAAARVRGRCFDLTVDSYGYWSRPRILWVGCRQTPEPLSALVRDLQDALATCGFEPERRPYAAHITLARKAHKLAGGDLEQSLVWPVREFVLMGSDLDAPPPRYRVLRRWSLH